jgi:peptidoglycan hydrolase-like protein with peptidoglycan-binding domain
MRTEVVGAVALGLLATACSSSGVYARAEADLAPAEGSSPVRQAQSELQREGLYDGKVDGIAGPETRQGISAFQRREGLPQTDRLDQTTVDRMNLRALRMDDWKDETAQGRRLH